MASVNNATGVYSTLGYNFSDPNGYVQPLSANTQSNLNQFPAIIEPWQAQDIANNSVSGYFQNPVATYVNNIIYVANQIFTLANTASGANSSYTGTANVSGIATVSASLMSDASSFLAHTNRVSGVTSIYGQTDTNVNPYYQTATSYGKQAIMLVNQTDGITNNSPILGCMTSILIGPQINSGNTTISNDLITLTSGISGNNLSNAQGVIRVILEK